MKYMPTLKTACYSEETVEFNVLQIFWEGGGPLFGHENHDTNNIYFD